MLAALSIEPLTEAEKSLDPVVDISSNHPFTIPTTRPLHLLLNTFTGEDFMILTFLVTSDRS
jgi:hypothetical protein